MDATISRVANAKDAHPSPSTYSRLFKCIASDAYRQPVRYIRDCIANGDEDAAADAKKMLPAAMPSGSFRYRNAQGCVSYNGTICLDLDDVDDLESAVELVASLPWVFGWFRSPSGTGIKVFAKTNATRPDQHHAVFLSAQKYMANLGIEIDKACSDICRLCFVSWDRACVLRDATDMPVDYSIKAPIVQKVTSKAEVDHGDAYRQAIQSLATIGDAVQGRNGDATTWTACNIGHDHGIPENLWWPVVAAWNDQHAFPPWGIDELRAKLASSYRNCKRPFGAAALMAGLFDD